MTTYSNILPDYRIWVDNTEDIDILIDKKNNYANPLVLIGNIIYVVSEDAHYYITAQNNSLTYKRLTETFIKLDETISVDELNNTISNIVNVKTKNIDNNLKTKIDNICLTHKNSKLYLDYKNDNSTVTIQFPEATSTHNGILSVKDKNRIDSSIQGIVLKDDRNTIINLEKNGDNIILPIYTNLSLSEINDTSLVTGKAVKLYIDNIISSISKTISVKTPDNEENISTYTIDNTTYIQSTQSLKDKLNKATTAVQNITTGSEAGTINVDSNPVKINGWDSVNTKIENIEKSVSDIEEYVENINISEDISKKLEELTYNDTVEKNKFVTSVTQVDGKISVTKSEIDVLDFKNYCNILYLQQDEYDKLQSLNSTSKTTIYIIVDNTGEPIKIYIGELLFADKKDGNTVFPYTFPMIF